MDPKQQTAPAVAPKAEQTVSLSVVEALIAKIQEIATSGGGITAEQFDQILKKNAAESAEAIGKIVIPEHKVTPQISVFSYPEGETARPKARLSDKAGNPRPTFFCSVRMKEDQLTPYEIDAFNAIQHSCESRNGSWFAKVQREGERESLLVQVPCLEVDQRMELPSLLAILKELGEGPAAVDLVAITAQLQDLRDKLALAGVK